MKGERKKRERWCKRVREGNRVRDRVREKEKERWCERVRDRER